MCKLVTTKLISVRHNEDKKEKRVRLGENGLKRKEKQAQVLGLCEVYSFPQLPVALSCSRAQKKRGQAGHSQQPWYLQRDL